MADCLLRAPLPSEREELTRLGLRSKAVWGYDDAFMAACVEELTVTESDLPDIVVATRSANVVGIAQVSVDGHDAELEKLFVAPEAMGTGVGRQLFEWCRDRAAASGAQALRIVADTDALPFYQRMGAHGIGETPSGSIAGRRLPVLSFPLMSQVVA